MGKKNRVRLKEERSLCGQQFIIKFPGVLLGCVYPRILPAVIANKEISLLSGEYLSLSDGR